MQVSPGYPGRSIMFVDGGLPPSAPPLSAGRLVGRCRRCRTAPALETKANLWRCCGGNLTLRFCREKGWAKKQLAIFLWMPRRLTPLGWVVICQIGTFGQYQRHFAVRWVSDNGGPIAPVSWIERIPIIDETALALWVGLYAVFRGFWQPAAKCGEATEYRGTSKTPS